MSTFNYKIKTQHYKLQQNNWKYLIILDACRYDFFSNVYKDYFMGNLERTVSLGSCTSEWCLKTFKGVYKDVIYISANPYINSRYPVGGFEAKKHFDKIVDVWNYGWNKKLGTVHPKKITETAIELINKYPNKRFIVHYLQPHAPYITKNFLIRGFTKPELYNNIILNKMQHVHPNILGENFYNNIYSILSGIGGRARAVNIIKYLGLPQTNPMDFIVSNYGVEGLKNAYLENLHLVLNYVSILTPHLNGNTIITSDHGEFLGENHNICHPCGSLDPILKVVPWFHVRAHTGDATI